MALVPIWTVKVTDLIQMGMVKSTRKLCGSGDWLKTKLFDAVDSTAFP